MSARASGKSLEKYYLHSRGKVLWLFLLQVLCYYGLLVKNSDMQVLKLWIHWDLRYMCTHIINEWSYLPCEDLLINVLKKLAAT
jgi:hypothetical protein